MTLLFPEFSFNNFIKKEFGLNSGGSLSDYQRKQLFDGLGLSDFMLDAPCVFGVAPYQSSGWTNGRYMSI